MLSPRGEIRRYDRPTLSGVSPPRTTPGNARKDTGSLVVDDLLQGMNEWRNIQDVIRSTFKALHDVIKAQGDAVKSLERQMETKASVTDVQVQSYNSLIVPKTDSDALSIVERRPRCSARPTLQMSIAA